MGALGLPSSVSIIKPPSDWHSLSSSFHWRIQRNKCSYNWLYWIFFIIERASLNNKYFMMTLKDFIVESTNATFFFFSFWCTWVNKYRVKTKQNKRTTITKKRIEKQRRGAKQDDSWKRREESLVSITVLELEHSLLFPLIYMKFV